MRYYVKVDDCIVFDNTINSKALRLINAVVVREINTCGSFTFTIDSENTCYSTIRLLSSRVSVVRYNETAQNDECLFYGRPISIAIDSQNIKVITCEGLAGTLNDSILAAYTKTGTGSSILADIIEKHNAFCGSSIVSGGGGGNSFTFKLASRGSAMVALNQLCKSREEYSWYPTYTADGGCSISLVKSVTSGAIGSLGVMSHGITYGYNLVSIDTEFVGSDVCSIIYPVGNGGVRLASGSATIDSDITRESYMLKSASAIERYGKICKLVEFDSASTSAELQRQAVRYLQDYSAGTRETKIVAYDTGDFDGLSNFYMLMAIPFSSPLHAAHDPDSYYRIIKLTNDLCNPANDTVEVGSTRKTLTKMI